MVDLSFEGKAAVVAAVGDEGSQNLTFSVGGERFAVDILDIREIIEVGMMTSVPLAPEFIRGVVNLRGNVLPVVDLAVRLGRKRKPLTKRSCIVVIEVSGDGGQPLGILVDEVNEILDIPAANIQPAPSFGGRMKSEFIRAMGRVEDAFIILLNMNHVLTQEDLSQLEELTRFAESAVLTEKASGS
jgi:purine-binding chemotaxis protein CheW